MKKDLGERFGVIAQILYDKPKESFGPISTEESHKLFLKLGKKYREFLKDSFVSEPTSVSAFTEVTSDGNCDWIHGRPAILISSTSWTKDEDFGILLEALVQYDKATIDEEILMLPKLLCVITGKGPQKEYYCTRISQQVKSVINTVFLYYVTYK